MSSDFAPELRAHDYPATPEDSMHRSLDDHLKHPASGEVAAIVDGTAPGVGVERCGDVEPHDGYVCTFPAGHEGDHGQEVEGEWDTTCASWAPAPLVDAPDDVEALAEWVMRWLYNGPEGHRAEPPPREIRDDLYCDARNAIEAILASDYLAARDADLTARAEAAAVRGIRFRVEVACDGYANLMDSDVPDHIADLAAYQEGAHDAAEAIRAAASYTRDGADGEADHG